VLLLGLGLGGGLLLPPPFLLTILMNIRFIRCLCSQDSLRAMAISSRQSWYSRSLCSDSLLNCCSLYPLFMRLCIIIMYIIIPKEYPSSLSSLVLDGDFLGIHNGCVNALVFFCFPPPRADAPNHHFPPLFVDMVLLDAAVLAVAASGVYP
jgi:hypothetical protein